MRGVVPHWQKNSRREEIVAASKVEKRGIQVTKEEKKVGNLVRVSEEWDPRQVGVSTQTWYTYQARPGRANQSLQSLLVIILRIWDGWYYRSNSKEVWNMNRRRYYPLYLIHWLIISFQ